MDRCAHGLGASVWQRLILLCACLLFVSQGCAAQSPAGNCSGRGHVIQGTDRCVCDSPFPQPGAYGYGGPNCDMRIFGASANGADVTSGCQSTGCNFLQPNDWMCFSVPFARNGHLTPWNYLTIQLNRLSEDDAGDPDLYGMFYGGSQAKPLDRQTFMYDFRETSSSTHQSVVKKVQKADFNATTFDHSGAYLCVKAYGDSNLTYSLRATTSTCPSDFTATGDQLLCSSPLSTSDPAQLRYSACLADGTCLCKAPYAKPVESVYPLLGFEDCSAKVEQLDDAHLSLLKPYIEQHEQLAPKAWAFYSFETKPNDYQVVINIAAETDPLCPNGGYFGAFVKYGQPPGWRYGEWDFRPEWNYFGERQEDVEVRFDASKEAWQTGHWYLGVNGDDANTCKYTLSISKYSCPMNCSNRGVCMTAENNTRTCDCNKGYFGEDCSNEAVHLQYGVPMAKEAANFEYDYFQLPDISPAMLTHSVEVRIRASFSSEGYGAWAAVRPELLLLKGDLASQPHTGNYTFKQVMQTQNMTYEIDLCPSQLKQGIWRAAIHNPMRIYKLAYNLTTVKEARCLNNCTGHGSCSEDAICHCEDNWTGGDCSVYARGGCQPGSRASTPMAEAHGTCWHECHCDGAGTCMYNDNECMDFTCDNGKWRRQGQQDMCVLDTCTKDTWVEGEGYSCLKKCNCPADGSACTLGATCDPQHFVCKAGYQRFSDGQAKCFKPGCAAGSLHEAVGRSVSNGQAYAVCTCRGEETEGEELCTVGLEEDAAVMVACNKGYMVQGSGMDSGSNVAVNGWCVKAAQRRSWVTVLLATCWLLLGGVVGAGMLWLYENRFRRSNVNAALYHELSMDTGF